MSKKIFKYQIMDMGLQYFLVTIIQYDKNAIKASYFY